MFIHVILEQHIQFWILIPRTNMKDLSTNLQAFFRMLFHLLSNPTTLPWANNWHRMYEHFRYIGTTSHSAPIAIIFIRPYYVPSLCTVWYNLQRMGKTFRKNKTSIHDQKLWLVSMYFNCPNLQIIQTNLNIIKFKWCT